MTEDPLNRFEVEDREDFFEGRIFGEFSVPRFNKQIDHITAACRKHKRDLLLIDLSQLHAELSLSDRFDIATHGASAAARIKVALLAAPEHIEPRKFGILVARNRGLTIELFTERKEALRWLLVKTKSRSR